MDEFTQALRDVGLEVDVVAQTLNVRHGTGPMARSVNIDPEATGTWLREQSEQSRARDLASWANGVLTTLLEPKRSDARQWSFVEAAGSLFPTIEGPGFAHGVRDATGGEPAWTLPLDGELSIAWVLRLGRGIRPLTAPHFDEWSATRDRVVSAGRSLLFHSTRHHHFREDGGVLELAVGDGHDAARLIVVGDVFFTKIDSSWRFAIPHPDVLLAVRDSTGIDALKAQAHQRYEAADYPLDDGIWKLRGSEPVRDD